MIESSQILFIGNVVWYSSSDRPSKCMLTDSCNNSIPEQAGRPKYHNKDILVRNFYILFKVA